MAPIRTFRGLIHVTPLPHSILPMLLLCRYQEERAMLQVALNELMPITGDLSGDCCGSSSSDAGNQTMSVYIKQEAPEAQRAASILGDTVEERDPILRIDRLLKKMKVHDRRLEVAV